MSEVKKKYVNIPIVAGEDKIVECCLNGKNYTIMRGKKVQIPIALYENLVCSNIIAGELK